MYFTPVSGDDLCKHFYKGILEDDIRDMFLTYYSIVNPRIVGTVEDIAYLRHTDGIIRFYDKNDNPLGWAIQETKRDIGLDSVQVPRAFLQAIMYLGNVFYDVNILGVDNFIGIILNSARYFVFISKSEVIKIMEDFEPLWNRYYRIAPCNAHKEFALRIWAEQKWHDIKKECYNLNNTFKLDEFFETIYIKYLNYGINNGTDDAREGNSHQR